MPRPMRPLSEHIDDGSYRPSAHGPLIAPPSAAVPIPDPPADLPPRLKAYWRDLVAELAARGLWAAGDAALLERGLRAQARADTLAERVDCMAEHAPPGELAKLQSAAVSAQVLAIRMLSLFGVGAPRHRATVRATPIPEPTDSLER